MGVLEGRAVEGRIGLSTAEEPFLFEISDSELAMKRGRLSLTWWLLTAIWLWVGTSCA